MGVNSRSSQQRTFGMRTSSMSSRIGRGLSILRLISTRDVLETSGAQTVPSFSRVSTFRFRFSCLVPFLMSFQTSGGGFRARISSRHLSKPHTGGSVHSPSGPTIQGLSVQGMVINAGLLSHWNARVKIGNSRLTIYAGLVILVISIYASVLGGPHSTARYVAKSTLVFIPNFGIASGPFAANF